MNVATRAVLASFADSACDNLRDWDTIRYFEFKNSKSAYFYTE